VTSSPFIVCRICRETVQLLLLPVKSYLVHVGRCVQRSGEGFSGLACALRLQMPIWQAAVARRCCFINHFLLPVKSQRIAFAFITKHWRPNAVKKTAAFVTGPVLC